MENVYGKWKVAVDRTTGVAEIGKLFGEFYLEHTGNLLTASLRLAPLIGQLFTTLVFIGKSRHSFFFSLLFLNTPNNLQNESETVDQIVFNWNHKTHSTINGGGLSKTLAKSAYRAQFDLLTTRPSQKSVF